MNFEADIAPSELYENLCEDEELMSYYKSFSEEFCNSDLVKTVKYFRIFI